MIMIIRLYCTVLFLVCASPVFAQQRVALLIGNQDYARQVGPLNNPINDVNLIAAALRKIGFARRDIRILKNGSRRQILAAIDAHAEAVKRAGPNAIGFFYYSGHGAASKRDRRNYLIPVGVERLDAGVWYDAIPLQTVVTTLSEQAGNAAHFVVFDACRNLLNMKTKGAKGFVPAPARRGMLIAFSTDPGETASDEGRSSGPYAAALAAELVKPGLAHLDIFQNVKEAVYRKTKVQVPWERNGLIERIYLAGRPLPGTSRQTVRPAAPPESPKVSASAAPARPAPPAPAVEPEDSFIRPNQRFTLAVGETAELGRDRALLAVGHAYAPNGGTVSVRLDGKRASLNTGQFVSFPDNSCRVFALRITSSNARFKFVCKGDRSPATGVEKTDVFVRNGQLFALAIGQTAELGKDGNVVGVKYTNTGNRGTVSVILNNRRKGLNPGQRVVYTSSSDGRCAISVRKIERNGATFRLQCRR